MAVQKEIWQDAIVNGLFAENTFLAKSVNDSVFVQNGKRVHIPNAGRASKVEMDRSVLPAVVKQRTDTDIAYDLHEFTTDPIVIRNAEEAEVSYSKRESVLQMDRAALFDRVAEFFIREWAPDTADYFLKTTGAAAVAHTPSATGNRRKLMKKDVRALSTLFNKQNVSKQGRFLLLDAEMYDELLEDLTESQTFAFLSSADAQRGVVGNLYGFDIMSRATVLACDGTTVNAVGAGGKGTDCAAGLAWQQDCVSRALGEVIMNGNEGDPTWYGDVYSFLVRAGGTRRRADKKGVAAILQATTA